MIKNLLPFLLIVTLSSCSVKPYQKVQKKQDIKMDSVVKELTIKPASNLLTDSGKIIQCAYVPTVNFGLRKPNFVIIHHTAQDSIQQTINTFIAEKTQVSAHYVIARDGKMVQMLNDDLRSWHAGNSKWGAITDMNSISLGIELDNNGNEPFTAAQIESLLQLLAKIKTVYKIPASNFIGHADVAPKRKTDPSVLFPWKLLSDKGFGLWYNNPEDTPPADFDIENALRRIGYDTSDLSSAIVAFKRHFVQNDVSPIITDWDKCILYHLYKKY